VGREVRARLALIGRPIGHYDVLITGQTLPREVTLVTHNTAEFGRIEGLAVEDWEAP
jgi:tRNA(fMet)-specific endonuclease VapC